MGKYKTDMHIHTFYSDGQAAPADIVKKAKELGYEKIAITDHDGTDGIGEALKEGENVGLNVVPGIELACITDEGIGLHILGYDIDTENTDLKSALKVMAEKRAERNRKLIAVLNDMGYSIKQADLRKYQPNNFIGKPVIARALVSKGYAENVSEVFSSEKLLGSKRARAIKKEKITARKAVEVIKGAGGSAALAHPIQTRHIGCTGSEEFYDNISWIIKVLKGYGLEGLECFHPDQDRKQTLKFMDIAKKYGLYVTRGSDFHGKDFAEAEDTAEI